MNMNLPLLLDLFAKSAGIMLLAFAVQSLWRGASAAHRCLVWLAAFAVLLILPLTLALAPRWSVTLSQPKPAITLPPVMVSMDAPIVVEKSLSESSPSSVEYSVTEVTFLVWFSGVALVLGYRLLGSWQLFRLRSRSSLLHHEGIQRLTRQLAKNSGIRREIELREATEVSVPVTWGIIKPVLLLPIEAQQWSEAKLEAALRHELAHVLHLDAMTRLGACFVSALYWPNLLVWLAVKAWRTAQEQAADDRVMEAGVSAEHYAFQLLEAARLVQSSRLQMAPVLAMAQPSTLETRLCAIMDESRNRRAPQRQAVMAGAGVGLLLLGLSASWQLRAEETAAPLKVEGKASSQVQMSVKVLECPKGAKLEFMSQATVILNEADTKKALNQMTEKAGADVLSAPSVTALSGQKAVIEVGQEMPVDKTKKEITFVGVRIELMGTVMDGIIEMNAKPLLREIERMEAGQPVFSTRQVDTTVRLKSGDTAVLSAGSRMKDGKANELFFFITAKELDAASPSLVQEKPKPKAAMIILPHVEFESATLEEAMEFFRSQSRQLDSAKQGINIVLKIPAKRESAAITLSLKNVPLIEAVRYVASLSDLELTVEGEVLVLHPKGTFTAEVVPETTVTKKTAAIIIPHLEFQEATVEEALDFLSIQSKQLDPAKEGLNLVLKGDAATDQVKLSLSLTNVPVLEALRYVASLSNLSVTAEGDAFILKPVGDSGKPGK